MRFALVPNAALNLSACAVACCVVVFATKTAHAQLRVSDNGRHLVASDGTPFFYLGDTAWELFHRLDRAEIDHYLEDRAAKGFTVIQAVALAELDGLRAPNAYGYLPLVDENPAKPMTKAGPANDYWDHVDYVFDKAESLGLTIGLLPTWGDKWRKADWGVGPVVFDPDNAEAYGAWLGKRFAKRNVIWILGGDRAIESPKDSEVIRRMAKGIEAGDGGRNLITFHPLGGEGSAQYFHDEPWLDFNMRQNGHVVHYDGNYSNTGADYKRTPVKPVMDSEPIYEDHPIRFRAAEFGHSTAVHVRRAMYWDLFSGAFGHTYGHHSVWQMWAPGRRPINSPLMPWREALQQPGAGQMQHGRRLIESRPMLTRIPADDVIVADPVPTSVPGAGAFKMVATRDEERTYAMVYTPVSKPFRVKMAAVNGEEVLAWWYNPRTGRATEIGGFLNRGEREFTPPNHGELLDWVLVLDDKKQGYPPPGARQIANESP